MARISKADALKIQQWHLERQPKPAKPACSPYECTIWNDTKRVWEIRPKDARALERAGLAPPKKTTKTTTTTTSAGATPASIDESNFPCSPHPATTTYSSSSSLGSLMAKKKTEPVLFRACANKARVSKRTSYMRTVTPRQVVREREAKTFEGVDERLKACRADQESDTEKDYRERLGRMLAKKHTKRDACDNNQWKARGYRGRR